MLSAQPLQAPYASAAVPERVRVAPADQWVSTTSGRFAPDGFSWMQAVCWSYLEDTYRRTRDHGPRKVGETTLRVAAELARLAPCRPGVDFLARVLKLSERTIQYHLAILRESGLLAYRSKGTRVSGEGGQASEFVWIIPQAFDAALHLVTRTCDRLVRALSGIGDEGRALMKRLAKMAQKLLWRRRSRRSRTRSSGSSRCTPMGGSSDSSSSAGGTSLPPESKLEFGKRTSPTQKKSKAKARRTLNQTGRRFQLARELIEQVDWLRGCSVPRIAWVVRDVADAGFTAEEVRGWLHFRGGSARVRRASGLLAVLLSGAHKVLDTQDKRDLAVAQWHAASEAARRHRIQSVRQRSERFDGDWQAPRSAAVQRMVADAIAATAAPAAPAEALPDLTGPQDLTAEELQVMRQTAWAEFMHGDTALVTSAVEAFGRATAESMYGTDLVQRALRLTGHSALMSLGRR
ncbi:MULTISPECIES: helix-turn-helix domain-containing protein [Streptomyces]|uniref:helix-turn-helix domain-containing protein n=1 Tax=Streptomyces TaxID=1883 RepID=UPI000E6A70CC|nr:MULTISPECIES: helix-turn-helix domain-containing protein [Streptomyces]MDX3066045.1 helix-turn-helix domain-containing protein [Streptomyces sp. ND04-05B]MDX3519598.1 helix-turn-helix domain-containing protein [Streptomyces scabiei]